MVPLHFPLRDQTAFSLKKTQREREKSESSETKSQDTGREHEEVFAKKPVRDLLQTNVVPVHGPDGVGSDSENNRANLMSSLCSSMQGEAQRHSRGAWHSPHRSRPPCVLSSLLASHMVDFAFSLVELTEQLWLTIVAPRPCVWRVASSTRHKAHSVSPEILLLQASKRRASRHATWSHAQECSAAHRRIVPPAALWPFGQKPQGCRAAPCSLSPQTKRTVDRLLLQTCRVSCEGIAAPEQPPRQPRGLHMRASEDLTRRATVNEEKRNGPNGGLEAVAVVLSFVDQRGALSSPF
ncbi:hypothetical protein TRVL_02002 [Trypanosoma vivax]|nr:hypothetical protein TRVL_02002 [Trypanosoma vivax]